MNRLTITSDTSVAEIKTFLDIKDRDGKVLLKTRGDGVKELFVSRQGWHFKGRITGSRAQQKAAARDVLDEIFLKEGRKQKNAAPRNRKTSVGEAFNAVLGPITRHNVGRALKVGELAAFAEGALGIDASEKIASAAENRGGVRDVGVLTSRVGEGRKKLFTDFVGTRHTAGEEKWQGDLNEVLVGLADQDGGGARVLALASESEFKTFVMNALQKGATKDEFDASFSGEKLRSAHRDFADHVLGSRELDVETAIPLKDQSSRTLKQVEIGDVVYRPVRHLGTGGFADVFEYESLDGAKTIALKIPLRKPYETDDERAHAHANCAAEALMHEKAAALGSANALGYVGAVNSPENGVCIAVEIAPHGDVLGMAQTIRDKVASGELTDKQAMALRLTLLKDMAEGLKALQDADMFHGDFKPPNALIGEDGHVKISDFGNARIGTTFSYPDILENDNPYWLAPEILYAKQAARDARDLARPERGETTNRAVTDLQALFVDPKLSVKKKENELTVDEDRQLRMQEHLANGLAQAIFRPVIKAEAYGSKIGLAADSWALGVSAVNIMTGQEQFASNDTYMSAAENKIRAFGDDVSNVALAARGIDQNLPANALAETTGDPEVDRVVNGLLRPKPENRLDASDALTHRLFERPGVGSDAARALIVALHSGDADKIDVAKGALDSLLAA